MIKDIIVLDDVIPTSYQTLLEEKFLKNDNLPWAFISNITDNLSKDSYGISHNIFAKNSGQNSASYNLVLPLITQACEKINFILDSVYYARSFVTFPNQKINHNSWHTDMPGIDHTVALYYVNTASGPTLISELTDRMHTAEQVNSLEKVPVLKEIQPKKGRIVFFNGKYFHASSNPVDGYRCIINFDIGLNK